ncbi:tRNA lysidine(34) synthetase TilS [Geobacter grbiciae]|uniref:tRNA lysidine(34) synthetase TilS n=1 Tax=Geobacter grbiciae TaxID=155042 RepID=UPI001FE93837|nr:tRNA lysidine(34) synthetase TilS [Geobacter grbiciae]
MRASRSEPVRSVHAKVLAFSTEYSLFTPGDTVVVAVSGGADSVALLDILISLSDLRLNLVVAHLNHSLRGAESDGDERFVADLAASRGLPFAGEKADVRALSIRERLSLEDAGRRARYEFFDQVATQYGARSVALAHHADDQAETLLLRLLRGAGVTGLSAMAPRRDGRFVRPLLTLSRSEIEGYLHGRGLRFRIDSSNADTAFLRNRIRHELIPHLVRFNPEISRRLAVTADLLAADEEVLETVADEALKRTVREHAGEGVILDVAGLLREPRGVRYRIYRRAVALAMGTLRGLSYKHVLQIDGLVRSPKPNLHIPVLGGAAVVRAYGLVTFKAAGVSGTEWEDEIIIEGPGCYPLPDGGEMVIDVVSLPADLGTLPSERACFDLDCAPFPWVVRGFRPGDRINPLGMTGTKKVKDIFIDEKVPRERRRLVPLVFSNSELVWVCGYRTGHHARVTEKTVCTVLAEVRTSTGIALK